MTDSQKSRLGQGLFFGAFFIVLGSLMKYWEERGTAPYNGGQAAMVLGIIIALWGVVAIFMPSRENGKS